MECAEYGKLSADKKDDLDTRLVNVENWLEKFAPEFVKFKVQEKCQK